MTSLATDQSEQLTEEEEKPGKATGHHPCLGHPEEKRGGSEAGTLRSMPFCLLPPGAGPHHCLSLRKEGAKFEEPALFLSCGFLQNPYYSRLGFPIT